MHVLKLFLVIVFSSLLFACGSSNGGDNNGNETPAGANSVKIGASVDLQGSMPSSMSEPSLTLHVIGGDSYEMKKNTPKAAGRSSFSAFSNSEQVYYYADVPYASSIAFYIEATVGSTSLGLFSQNTVTSSDKELSLVVSSDSTLDFETLKKVKGTNQADWINNDINFEKLHKNNATTYDNFRAALTWDAVKEVNFDVKQFADSLDITNIQLTEQEKAEKFIKDMFSEALVAGKNSFLEKYQDKELFIHMGRNSAGYLKEDFIFSDFSKSGAAPVLESFSVKTFKPVSAENPLYDAQNPVYAVQYAYVINSLDSDNKIINSVRFDDEAGQAVSTYVKNKGGKWYILGNQEKVEYDIAVFSNYTEFTVYVSQTYPIKSVALIDEKRSVQKTFSYDSDDKEYTSEVLSHTAGDKYTVKIEFVDGSVEKREFIIPELVSRSLSVSLSGNTISYTHPIDNESEIAYIDISAEMKNGDDKEYNYLPFSARSLVIPQEIVSSIKYIYLEYVDIYGRHFSKSFKNN